ncbi:hypothetical protein G9A89_013644 [Geosiphon pyriformis]|nr:hypothetical protein G9A89_013644 [Geosiphon pyriformis]
MATTQVPSSHLIRPYQLFDDLRKLQVNTLILESAQPVESLVFARVSDPISLAIDQFRIHNVISLPIYDEEQGRFVTIINVLDMVRFLMLKEAYRSLSLPDNSPDEEKVRIVEAVGAEIRKLYYDTRIEDLISSVAVGRPLRVYHPTDPLLDALRAMGYGTENVYSILVSVAEEKERAEKDIKYASIISQWDAITFLLKSGAVNKDGIKDLRAKQVMQCAWITFHKKDDPNQLLPIAPEKSALVLSITKDVSALAAFRIMAIHKVSSLAIISHADGSKRQLLDNISASDIRHLKPENLIDGFLAVTEFLKKLREHPPNPISCDQDTPLPEMMEMALKNNVHRVWVIEKETGSPIGVITLGEMLSTLVGVDGVMMDG